MPWEEPLEQEYWLALLEQGEHPMSTPPFTRNEADRHETPEPKVEKPNPPQTVDTTTPSQPLSDAPNWELAQAYLEQSQVLTLPVTDHNRGGIIVDWNGWPGFVPASHLLSLPSYLTEEQRRNELAARVGAHIKLKIIELDPERNRLILSEKAVFSEHDHADQLMDGFCPGDILRGRVTNLCSFGAFVDLGGVEGLIHISELSWGRVGHPSDVLCVGQEAEVYVLNIDRHQRRIGLSLKRLQPDPWSSLEERYVEGQLVQGKITNVVSFGAFARIEDGVEGLIHVSELVEGDLHPRNVISEGETVTVRIVNIDSANHRLGLSLRQANNPPHNSSHHHSPLA